jgi:hypothetical protein
MTRKPVRQEKPDWRRDHMWVGKGVPFWFAVLAIAGIAWALATWFSR